MAFFALLVGVWLVLWLLSFVVFRQSLRSHAFKGRLAFAAGFIFVGITHLLKPETLTYMIEPFMSNARFWVIFTGIFEIAAAILLLVPKFQKWCAWLIILYLVGVFPANIYVAVHNLPAPGGLPAKPWYVWSRLLFQPLYIAWIYLAAIRSVPPGKS